MAHSALSVIDVYEQLLSAPDDKTRARIIATAFERLEDRYPELKDLATATGVRETELRLLKEIEKIRQETQQIRADMHKSEQQIQANMHAMEQQIRKEIEQIRADMHAMEQKISKDIEQIRADMHAMEQKISKDIEQIRADMHTMEQKISKDIEHIRADMHQTELRLQKEIAEVNLKIEMTSKTQVQWMVGLFFTFAFTLIAAMFGVSVL